MVKNFAAAVAAIFSSIAIWRAASCCSSRAEYAVTPTYELLGLTGNN